MFLPRDRPPTSDGYDAIVIGSGPAGLTVAAELDAAGRRVLVLESDQGSGDLPPSIGYGHLSGDYWDRHSPRGFGGASADWDGWTGARRALDFNHPHAGAAWPIARADLDPYYRRAAPILGLDPAAYEFEREILPAWLRRPFAVRTPTRFGEKYQEAFSRSTRADVALGYSAVGFEATRSRSAISAIRVFDHRTRTPLALPIARHQAVVAAAGGLGNAQLLLQPHESGPPIGNESGLAGRFLMDHVHVPGAGECVADLDLSRDAPPAPFGTRVDALVVEARAEVDRQLIGCSLELAAPSAGEDPIAPPVASNRTLAPFRLNARAEMRPSASNRVEIMPDRSRSGLYPVSARAIFDADDLRNVEETVRFLGETLMRLDRGRARVNNNAIYEDATGGGRAMGTTRMGVSRASSVVDAECRVHGYSNFFVAGSSVFPSAGYANPTFTVVALAIRLADHLARRPAAVGAA